MDLQPLASLSHKSIIALLEDTMTLIYSNSMDLAIVLSIKTHNATIAKKWKTYNVESLSEMGKKYIFLD
jgi:hypothetical protein